jgi:hypothetical protein
MRHSTLTGYLYFTLLAVPDTDYDNKNAQDSKPNERRYQFKHSYTPVGFYFFLQHVRELCISVLQ